MTPPDCLLLFLRDQTTLNIRYKPADDQRHSQSLPIFPVQVLMSEPTTPKKESTDATIPQTPSRSTFALTEYTANPSPNHDDELNGTKTPSANADPTATTTATTITTTLHSVPPSSSISQVPEAFLLPNGYPDVLSDPIVMLFGPLRQKSLFIPRYEIRT